MEDLFEYLSNVLEDFDFRKLIFPTIMILLYISGFFYLYTIINKKNNTNITKNIITKEVVKEEIKEEFIYIDVKGSVNKPGVYKIKSDSRVKDAIEAAGGLSKDANTRYINLSKALNDSDVVVVYSDKEIDKAKEENIIYIETPCVCEEVKNDACITDNNEEINNKVNINTSDIEGLKTLYGIGDAKAKAIIEYRNNNGNFKKIEDIKNVTGISDSLFEKIKDYITI